MDIQSLLSLIFVGGLDLTRFNLTRFSTVFIDKDPDNLWKGWGWVDIDGDAIKKYGIRDLENTSSRWIHIEQIPIENRSSFQRGKCGTSDGLYEIRCTGRGRTGG